MRGVRLSHRETVSGESRCEGSIVHVHDVADDPEYPTRTLAVREDSDHRLVCRYCAIAR